jgi:hypothetical protein
MTMLRVRSATAARVSTSFGLPFSLSRVRGGSVGSTYFSPWCRYWKPGLVGSVVNVLPPFDTVSITISSECEGR